MVSFKGRALRYSMYVFITLCTYIATQLLSYQVPFLVLYNLCFPIQRVICNTEPKFFPLIFPQQKFYEQKILSNNSTMLLSTSIYMNRLTGDLQSELSELCNSNIGDTKISDLRPTVAQQFALWALEVEVRGTTPCGTNSCFFSKFVWIFWLCRGVNRSALLRHSQYREFSN